MNLFQKYGIKEVADVVFYSVTVVGDEEFYTPVLFLDTLKVSTLEKSAEKVEARGGKGNKKLITWNFGKEITLNLEDALFSPASMSMIWGGKLNSKLSDYTSAIVKCNLANKYGDLHYSTKAYPSPALTDDEWEIVFNISNDIGLNSGSGNENPKIYIKDGENDDFVEENRNSLINQYFRRNRETSENRLTIETDLNGNINYQNFFTEGCQDKTPLTTDIYSNIQWKVESIRTGKYGVEEEIPSLQELSEQTPDINNVYTIETLLYIDYKEGSNEKLNAGSVNSWNAADGAWTEETTAVKLQMRYTYKDGKICPDTTPGQAAIKLVTQYKENYLESGIFSVWRLLGNTTVPCKDPYTFLVSLYGEENVGTGEAFDVGVSEEKAIPKIVIDNIMLQINSLDRLGYIDTDIHDIEVIDRMEKCIVKNRKGLKISSLKQKQNLFRYYADDKTSTYTIYYDAKTMLPLFRVEDGKIDESTDEFTIKVGTVYYKWTRTVKYKESDDDAILGKTLVIDAETFPDAYKIVGETYIRNQKTGKDQRYQFTIHRANVSTDTSVTLEAEGDPTTFSMQIDVLTPPNDIMMELKQYDVEDDPLEGGTRIVPQKSKYTYTPANIEYIEEVADKNEEIY